MTNIVHRNFLSHLIDGTPAEDAVKAAEGRRVPLAGTTRLGPGGSAPEWERIRQREARRCPARQAPTGQGNAALAGEHRAGAGGQAASPSVCAVGGLRASIPLAVRYRRILAEPAAAGVTPGPISEKVVAARSEMVREMLAGIRTLPLGPERDFRA